jgi:hypothetical protein
MRNPRAARGPLPTFSDSAHTAPPIHSAGERISGEVLSRKEQRGSFRFVPGTGALPQGFIKRLGEQSEAAMRAQSKPDQACSGAGTRKVLNSPPGPTRIEVFLFEG